MKTEDKFVLLTEEQIYGPKKLEIFKKFGAKCAGTDLTYILGSKKTTIFGYKSHYDKSSRGRTVDYYYLGNYSEIAHKVLASGKPNITENYDDITAVRPVLKSSEIFYSLLSTKREIGKGIYEVTYGEYPQYAPEKEVQDKLESLYQKNKLEKTGKTYTLPDPDQKSKYFPSVSDYDEYDLKPGKINSLIETPKYDTANKKYEEYEYNGKKYIRISTKNIGNKKLSNGIVQEDVVWLEVSPIEWILDEENELLIAKRALLSGIPYGINWVESHGRSYGSSGVYKREIFPTFIEQFLNKYMLEDILPISFKKPEITKEQSKLQQIQEEKKQLEEYKETLTTDAMHKPEEKNKKKL